MPERRKRLKLSTPAEVRRAVARIINMTLNGEISPQQANCIIAGCNAILSGIRTDEQERKIAELERLLLEREK